MIVIPRENWVFVLYAATASSLLFCAVVIVGIWKETRRSVFGLLVLFCCSLATMATGFALLQSPIPVAPLLILRLATRGGFLAAGILAPLTLFAGVVALNGNVRQVRRVLFFWRRTGVSAIVLVAALLAGCAPIAPAQFDTPQTEARRTFNEGAMYSCSGLVAGMADYMGLAVNMQVQTVALGVCSIYAGKVTAALWDGGLLPQDRAPLVPGLPADPL